MHSHETMSPGCQAQHADMAPVQIHMLSSEEGDHGEVLRRVAKPMALYGQDAPNVGMGVRQIVLRHLVRVVTDTGERVYTLLEFRQARDNGEIPPDATCGGDGWIIVDIFNRLGGAPLLARAVAH